MPRHTRFVVVVVVPRHQRIRVYFIETSSKYWNSLKISIPFPFKTSTGSRVESRTFLLCMFQNNFCTRILNHFLQRQDSVTLFAARKQYIKGLEIEQLSS